MSGWVSSSALSSSKPKSVLKRRAERYGTDGNTKKPIKGILENGVWNERFEPQDRHQLAVHKKKVDEVDQWIKQNVSNTPSYGNIDKAPILLIVGPTGSGKSVTLKVLARENTVHIKEWVHPLTVNAGGYTGDAWKYVGWNEGPLEKVIENFNDFLFESSRYKSIFDNECRQIIVLEDIPGAFLKHPEEFHHCLKKYRNFGRSPLVILLCETSSSHEFKLFPQELKMELSVHCISFNPVANTLLTKAVKSILQQASAVYGKAFNHSIETEIDSVVQSCNGDLRSAVNLLEIVCMGDYACVRHFESVKRAKGQTRDNDEKMKDIVKDSSLYIFHSLGKILYAKREESGTERLPPHLKHFEKPPLQEIPEAVFDRTCVSQDLFLNLLHSNAAHFYGNIESAAKCLEWFSFGDSMTSLWDHTGAMNALGLSTILRGLMFYLEKPKSKSNFSTFRKPSFDRKQVENRIAEMRRQFVDRDVSVEILVRDILPYLFKICPKQLSLQKWDVISNCVAFKSTVLSSESAETRLSKDFVPDEESIENDDDIKAHIPEEKSAIKSFADADNIDIEEINSD